MLYVRPSTGGDTTRVAMDEYARQVAREPNFEVWFLGDEVEIPGAAVLGRLASSADAEIGSIAGLLRTRREQILSAAHKAQPDIVHIRSFMGDFLFADLLGRRFGSRLVLDIHTLAIGAGKHAALRLTAPLTSLRFDHVLVQNETIRRTYCPWHPSVSELPIGIDAGAYPQRTGMRRPGGALRFAYAGTLHPSRRLDRVIRAFNRAISEGADVELHIFGDDPHRAALERAADPRGIHFHGHLDSTALISSLQDMDAGLAWVPIGGRVDANVPLKTLEMLAAGLPVIATATAGNRLWVSPECGILIGDDEASLIAAIRTFPNSAAARAEPATLQAKVAELDWRHLARAHLLPVYRALPARKR